MDAITSVAKHMLLQTNTFNETKSASKLAVSHFSTDAARFQFLMNEQNIATQVENAPIVSNTYQEKINSQIPSYNAIGSLPKDPISTIGGKILNSLQNVSKEVSTSWQQINSLANQDTFNMTSIVHAQAALITASLEFDLVGKVISKTTQNIDQLIKLQ